MREVPLALSQPHACPYIQGHVSQYAFIRAPSGVIRSIHDSTLSAGFRRSGALHYRQHCPKCDECKAIRISTEHFEPNKTQRRILKKNGDLTIRTTRWILNNTVLDLYNRYQFARHDDGEMAAESIQHYEDMFDSFRTTDLLCLTAYDADDNLVAVAINDITPTSISAVYTFYEPMLMKRSLGTWMILQQIDYARKKGLEWVYLGYWIRNNRKMGYKENFRPAEIYTNNAWVALK